MTEILNLKPSNAVEAQAQRFGRWCSRLLAFSGFDEECCRRLFELEFGQYAKCDHAEKPLFDFVLDGFRSPQCCDYEPLSFIVSNSGSKLIIQYLYNGLREEK